MCGPGDGGFEGETGDLDAGIRVRGVDYMSGWRDGREAAAEPTLLSRVLKGTPPRLFSGGGAVVMPAGL
ncbi:hypothetical protein SVIO_059120 [Streptomyces violaceusniger]|uniref:Uncharacterized protein n=1 Tax=Streptomyces violaceusniger TaxID=68280 RepID=A0A4D4LBB0_STRVO|nr:hypothetical protein SVIO_059120 [Streptomyces violaceusniger]